MATVRLTPDQLEAARDWRAPVGAKPRGPTQQEVNEYRAANRPAMYSRQSPIAPDRTVSLAGEPTPGQARPPADNRTSAVNYQASSPWPTIGRNRATAAEMIRADLHHVELPPIARQALADIRAECQLPGEYERAVQQIEYAVGANPRITQENLMQSARWSVEALRAQREAELGLPPMPQPPAGVLVDHPDGGKILLTHDTGPAPTRPTGPPAPTPAERAVEAGITAAPPATAPPTFTAWAKAKGYARTGESAMREYLKATGQE